MCVCKWLLISAGIKDNFSFAEVIGYCNAFFSIGIMFPKAQEHFIPFHTPGELSITMKEILKMTGNARSANSQGR